jgi:hypothetical protein
MSCMLARQIVVPSRWCAEGMHAYHVASSPGEADQLAGVSEGGGRR